MTQVPLPESQSEFDIEDLLAKTAEVLRREVKNLMLESSRGKLSAGSARDLVVYVELLKKLKLEEEEAARLLTDEQLKAAR